MPLLLVRDMFRYHAMTGVQFAGGAGKQLPGAARHIWKLALQINAKQDDDDDDDDGYLFLTWGTCLGFEYILMLASDNDDILQGGSDAENISLPLQLQQRMPQQQQQYLQQYPLYPQTTTTITKHCRRLPNYIVVWRTWYKSTTLL